MISQSYKPNQPVHTTYEPNTSSSISNDKMIAYLSQEVENWKNKYNEIEAKYLTSIGQLETNK